jgi:hypothetical protein
VEVILSLLAQRFSLYVWRSAALVAFWAFNITLSQSESAIFAPETIIVSLRQQRNQEIRQCSA